MRGKIVFVVGLATGYVLGARAGRERYEQIKAGAEKVWATPTVQAGVEKVQEFAGTRVDVAKAQLSRKARTALASLIGREPMTDPKQSSSRPAAKASVTRSSTAATTAKASAAKTAAAKATAAKAPIKPGGTESTDATPSAPESSASGE
ncbi:YtxH domain-containing protein [Herbiconiux sp. P15]|uniref:YtxH domain-containing protein n=1 Tax=Herbiconiux liukaitaii TaxID=3342799 RepID=UPI0035BA6258